MRYSAIKNGLRLAKHSANIFCTTGTSWGKMSPVVVVLDEPNSNLDEQGELALGNAIQRLKLRKVTVVVITHRSNVLANVNKLLILNDGAVGLYGPRDQVLAQLQQQLVKAAPAVATHANRPA
jgi:ABC-type protease/lipase transport system fused ATPase/permease subunit